MVTCTRGDFVTRMGMLDPAGNLLWRPQHSQLVAVDACQRPVLGKFADLWTTSSIPCRLIGLTRPIAVLPALNETLLSTILERFTP